MILKIDWGAVAQMITAVAAILALVISPWMAFNASRRLAVAQSRQQWLDALRSDVAEIIAIHETIVMARATAKAHRLTQPDSSADMQRVGILRIKIRTKLNLAEPSHRALNMAINSFVTTYDQDDVDYDPNKIVEAVDPITAQVWSDIKHARV